MMPHGAPRARPGRSAQTGAGAVWRPHPRWTERRQRSPPWCPYKGGRVTDRGRAAPCPHPPNPPDRPGPSHVPKGGRQAPPPPHRPPPHTPRRPDCPGRTGPPTRGHATQSQAGGRRDRTPPPEGTRQSTGPGHETRRGTNRLERPYQRPAPGPRVVRGLHRTRGGGGRVRRESTSAHERNRHAVRTRMATGPSPRNAQTAWNGAPAGEGKGHPDGTTRNRQLKDCGGRGRI